MKKNYFYGIAAALMMGTVALSSCSSDELAVGNETQIAKEVAKTYSFSIQATMNDEAGTRVFDEIGESNISSVFSTDEPVYMFIKRGNVIAYGNKALYPDQNGPTCTIDVTVNNDFYFIPTNFKPAEGDEVYLYYGMTSDTVDHTNGYYSFVTEGTWEFTENMDYNLAETTIKSVDNGVLTFNDKFSFKNINSIFRQKLEIFDENSAEISDYSTITKVVISSASNKMVKRYYPFGDEAYEYGPIVIENPDLTTDGSIYFSTIFIEGENDTDEITFTAYDEDGKTYTNSKGAPTSGFENNVYYYGDVQLHWISDTPIPTITGANFVENPGAVFSITDDDFDITISGNSEDYMFDMGTAEGSITLDNVTATNSQDNGFLYGIDTSLELTLTGDNSITCKTGQFCIAVGDLKLSCPGNSGDSATLTITHVYDYTPLGGIYSNAYNTQGGDLSALAAEGYTVTRSEPTDNDDGTFTWTYKVTKN